MTGLASELARAIAADGRAAIVAIAHGSGSIPREPGAWQVVSAGGAAGTIGGGHLEHEASRLARDAVAGTTPAATWLVRFPLAARLGQCCGGVATVAFAVVDAADGWLDVALACERTGAGFALVHRLGVADGAARLLVVTADDSRGSIGDADLDSAAVAAARGRLAPGGVTGLAEVGAASLFIHVVRPQAFDLLVFGNGHVGRALVQVLGALACRVRWIDEREADFPAHIPGNVEVVVTDAPADELADAPRGACVVVTTHSHILDFEIVEAALARDDWTYLGLIGSASKRAQFARRLASRGVSVDAFARVTCPIGASAGLAGKEPGVIAVGVAAEILALRERRASDGDHRGETTNGGGLRSAPAARGTRA